MVHVDDSVNTDTAILKTMAIRALKVHYATFLRAVNKQKNRALDRIENRE